MTTFWKATRPDGTDFRTGTVDYAAALKSGRRVRVRTPAQEAYECCTEGVLHASDVPTETLIGGSWPCRLFVVEGRQVARQGHKFGFRSLRMVEEHPAWKVFGPQGREVAWVIDRARRLTRAELDLLAAARALASHAARDAGRYVARISAWDVAWSVARDAARYAAWNAARNAAEDAATVAAEDAAFRAASAYLVQDLITPEQFDTVAGPWLTVIGEPDVKP